jgi:hypothetical protein
MIGSKKRGVRSHIQLTFCGGAVAKVVEHLLYQHKALSSNSSPIKKKLIFCHIKEFAFHSAGYEELLKGLPIWESVLRR